MSTAEALRVREKHPLWVRWTHWINFPLLGLMIWSGILIYWSNDIYRPFFPPWFYRVFGIDHRLSEGMAIHFTLMWFYAINGLVYGVYLAASGQWREMLPRRGFFRDSLHVVQHELGLRKTPPPQAGKFNAPQGATYLLIFLAGIGSIVSGLAIYKPIQLHGLTGLLGGYESARLVHFILMVAFVLFFFLHVAQVARAGWDNFRSMVAGFEVGSEPETVTSPADPNAPEVTK